MALGEVACRYQADEVRPEDLPTIAAEALAAGLDTPTLCELAGWPRSADARDIRDAFEQALSESGGIDITVAVKWQRAAAGDWAAYAAEVSRRTSPQHPIHEPGLPT